MNYPEQFELFPESEEDRRDAAIAKVEENNEPDPNEMALTDARNLLPHLPYMVGSDEIWPDLSPYGFTDNRAVGALMRKLADQGHITPTDEYRKSKRKGCHCSPTRLYINRLHRGISG